MMTDIHDIRPPIMVGWDPDLTIVLVWGLAGLVLAGLICAAVWYFKKRHHKKNQPLVTALGHVSPYDTAVRTLDQLATCQDAKTFYFELGRTIKAYIGARFNINCLELTTQELGRRIRDIHEIPSPLKSKLISFQDLCDPFRYAPLAPDQDQMQKDLVQGKSLIADLESEVKTAKDPGQKVYT